MDSDGKNKHSEEKKNERELLRQKIQKLEIDIETRNKEIEQLKKALERFTPPDTKRNR